MGFLLQCISKGVGCLLTVYEEGARMLRRPSTLTSDGEAIVHAVKRRK
jgi:hypothetical protein